MKHGDKAKAKSAKAKASGKEAGGKKVAAKSSKGAGDKVKAGGSKTVPKAAAKGAPAKADNGKGGVHFSNPVIAEAFRRAVKKYPTAFRRLTD